MLSWAVQSHCGPCAIRYPRGGNRKLTESAWKMQPEVAKKGVLTVHHTGEDAVLITYGTMIDNAMEAAAILESQGICCSVIRLLTVAPLPMEDLVSTIGDSKYVFVAEESCTGCGVSEALARNLTQSAPHCRVYGMDLGHRFARHGDLDSLYSYYGLDGNSIAQRIKEVMHREK